MMRTLPLAVALTALLVSFPAGAQAPQSGAPNSLLSENKDQPVQIEAATLEVRDKNKEATFSGNVQVVQGDTTMKCQSLVVFYGQEVGIGAGGAAVSVFELLQVPLTKAMLPHM